MNLTTGAEARSI